MLFRKFSNWLIVALLCVLPAAAQTVVRAGTTAVPWAPNISCSPGQFVAASPDNLHVFKAINLTPGTAANTQPTWNIFAGAVTVDGTCAWQEQGTLGLPGSGGVQSGPPQTLTNCTAAGTTLNEGVEFSTQLINGVTSLCGTTAAAASISVVGVCQTGCGNAGAAQIAYSGYQPGIFDNQTTQNHYVIPSATNPGQFTDIGATVPASTTENVGIVASTNTGAGTIATIFLAPLSLFARGSSGGSGVVNPPGCANGIAYYPGLGAVISSDCNFTTNGQGDFIAHSGTFNDILHAGYVNFIQGPAPPSAPATGVQLAAPTSVTGHTIYLPGSAQTGCATWGVFAGQPQLQGTGVACGAGAGSVTSFGANNLVPLFTTSVANPNTTPVLSFALTNAIANSIFGNFTNASGAPSYNPMSACGDSTHALSYILGTGFGCQLLPGAAAPQAGNPLAPTLANQNAAGARSITYVVQMCEDGPTCSIHSLTSTATIANANASPQVLLSAFADSLYGYRCANIYVTADSGARTGVPGLIATCVGKKYIDTGANGNSVSATNTNTSVLDANGLTIPLPGCNSIPKAPPGIDGPPCSANAMDDEMTPTGGAPADANSPFWAWINQNGATATWTNGMLNLAAPTRAGDNNNCLGQTTPTAPYTFVTVFYNNWTTTASHKNYPNIGFFETSSGKYQTIEINNDPTPNYRWAVVNWTNATTQSVFPYVGDAQQNITNPVYIKVQNDNTNLIYSVSPDGITYTQIYSAAKNNFFTTAPSSVVLCIDANVGAFSIDFDYFRRTQ